jgi:peptidoglycan/LPS O-acetylase OafA/YrhL
MDKLKSIYFLRGVAALAIVLQHAFARIGDPSYEHFGIVPSTDFKVWLPGRRFVLRDFWLLYPSPHGTNSPEHRTIHAGLEGFLVAAI